MKIILILIISFNYFSFSSNSNEKGYSPLTSFFIEDIDKLELDHLIKKYQIYTINDKLYVGSLILTNKNFNKEILEAKGCIIGADVEDIQSLKIPFDYFKEFANSSYFKYLQIDNKITIHLDQALRLSNDNEVQTSILGNSDFTYNNAIIGIIDFGFFYKHQMFLNSNNSNTRIISAWIQSQSSSSMRGPTRYNYGVEFNPNSNSTFQEDFKTESHASHVTGIAAGQSFFKNNAIRGVAPNAQIIAVTPIITFDEQVSTGESNVLDAIKYIFEYALNKNKAAVINMSLGHHIGPHDGTGLFDKACNKLSGPGRIIVTSAGNSGGYKNTFIKDFDVSQKASISSFNLYHNEQGEESIYLDIWNHKGQDYCIRFGNLENNSKVFSELVCTNSDLRDYYVVNNGNSRFLFRVKTTFSNFNYGKRIFVEVERISGDGDPLLEISSGNGKVFAWNCGLGGAISGVFTNLRRSDLVDGTNNYQIGEIGGNADSVITVAAYTSSRYFRNYMNYQVDSEYITYDLAPFSSLGPTPNEKLKPEISAPGHMITSALNPGDRTYIEASTTENGVADFGSYNNIQHYIGTMSGTSMSSPFVTGVIALMLTVNPYLGPKDIVDILQATAINDGYTGDIRANGSNRWGYGKVNIYPAVALAKERLGDYNINPIFKYYPNPVANNLNLEFQDNALEVINIRVLDGAGKIHLDNYSIDPQLPISQIPFKSLAPGFYIVEMKSGSFQKSINIIKGID